MKKVKKESVSGRDIVFDGTFWIDKNGGMLNSIAEQIADAREEAIAEGHAEGRAEGRAETVRKLLAAGISASAIADALGLTVEECLSYTKDKAL